MHLSKENSAGYLQRVQIFLNPSLANCVPDGILQQWSLIIMDFLCHRHSGKDLELHLPRENAHLSLCYHEGLRSYAAWSSKLNICK